MKFIKRFSASLFKPKDIVHFRMDSIWFVLLYILVLSILVTIPSTILAIKDNGLDYDTKKQIKNAVIYQEEIPFMIQNNELIATGDIDYVYETDINDSFGIVISLSNTYTSNFTYNKAIVFINSEGIFLKQTFASMKICDYADHSVLNNLDFRLANDNDSNFWDSVFAVVSDEIEEYKDIAIVTSTFLTFGINVGSIVILSLTMAIAGIFFFFGIVPFKETWRMYIYLITPYVIGNLLATLFGIGIFYYIGIVLMIVYALIVSQAILRIKIRKD